ncbi:MAG: DUF4272 domain-containing protein [Verrucomicrobiia bacterium]|jgi:hypothetical protein
MPEPATIYSTRARRFSREEIASWAPAARIEGDGEGDEWESINLVWPDGSLTVNQSEQDRGKHLNGFRGYVMQSGGQSDARVYALLHRLDLVRHCYGTIAEPGINDSVDAFLKRMADEGRGLIFRDDCVYDPSLRLLLNPNGARDEGRLEYWPDSVERQERSCVALHERRIEVPAELPPVPGEPEVRFRKRDDITNRCMALYATACRAVPGGVSARKARGFLVGYENALSPAETEFLEKWFPDRQSKIQFAWRFESLWALLWVLGMVEEIGEPMKPRTVDEVGAAMGLPSDRLFAAELRPASEILDQLDFIYRCHWATTDARIKAEPPPGGLDPGVVMERHHALKWLTCFQNTEWDDVATDT